MNFKDYLIQQAISTLIFFVQHDSGSKSVAFKSALIKLRDVLNLALPPVDLMVN